MHSFNLTRSVSFKKYRHVTNSVVLFQNIRICWIFIENISYTYSMQNIILFTLIIIL